MAKRKKGPRRRLKEAEKRFVTQRLAQCESPKEAAEALKVEFGVEISPQSVEHYDPNKRAGAGLARHLQALFEETRKRFLKYIDVHVPEANKAVRILYLARASRAFKDNKNYVAMADMFERIAKELGNVHSNRREITGKHGGPVKFQDVDMMTEEQVDNELRKYGFDPDVHPSHKTKH